MAAQTAQDAVRGQVPDTADEFGHQLAVEHAREVAAKAYVADMIASGIGGIRGESMYDLQALVDLQLGQSPDYGRPIEDLSETGPLGSLWPRGEPNRPSGLNAPVQSWGYVMTRRRFWLGLALVFVVAIVVLAVSGTLGEIIKTIRWVPGS